MLEAIFTSIEGSILSYSSKLPGYASFTPNTNFLRGEQGVQSQPGGRYVHVVVWLIFPPFILLFFQSLAQDYDTGTAPELPMAAKYTPVGGNVNILRHPPTRQNICCLVYYTLDVHPIVHCIVILIHIYICWIYILLYIVL